MEDDLSRAIRIAAEAHEGQTDKAGAPYILHPLRVMMQFDDPLHQIVAVLHDVVEDADYGWEVIHDGRFGTDVLDAIDAISRWPGEEYSTYIERVAKNPLAKAVKLADLADNMYGPRSRFIPDSLLRRYSDAQARLLVGADRNKEAGR